MRKDIKDKFVAIELNGETCKRVLQCKTITASQYNDLVNEQNACISVEELEKQTIKEKVLYLSEKVSEHDLLLAKSIYDNFIDRGLIDDNEEFQKEWYDFIFNDKKLKDYPCEFETILEKVVKAK